MRPRAIPLLVFVSVLILLIANALATHAQFSNVPVTGFNVDVVADGTAGTTAAASTNSAVDGNTVGTGYVFVSTTFGFGSTVCISGATALPANNQITSTNTTTGTGITYVLQSYGAGAATNNNSLSVPVASSGTLTLTTPVSAATLYAVCLGGNGNVNFTATVHYSDNSSETITPAGGSAPDWCGGASTYKLTSQQYYRISATATSCSGAGCQYIYEVPIQISPVNYGKLISSVTFNNTIASGSVFLHVMAMGMKAPCATPAAATALSLTAPTTSGMTGSFTAAAAATGYLVVRYPSGSTPVAPVNGTTYAAGLPLGTGTVVSSGTTTTFTVTGLTAGSNYDVYVYSYNSGTTCGGPIYSTTALTGSQSTTACGAPTLGTVSAGVRTITVGPTGNTPTITAALADINTNGINSPTIIELQSNYVSTGETFPVTIPNTPCFSATNTLTIRPAAGANGLVIKGVNAGATIDFNGANYVTIDGRPGGTGSSITNTTSGSLNTVNLNIVNTNVAGVAVKLDNSAGFNTIKYCDLQGRNTAAAATPSAIAGVVYFDNTGANGNDNNTITFCNVHADSITVFPTIGIYSLGTNVTSGYAITSNDNNTVSNSNIYDYSAASNSVGLELNYGNSGWTITNNSFFEPGNLAITAYNRAIWAIPYRASGNVGNGFTITNNYIGGTQPLCGGTPYTITTSGYFDGIRLEPADGTAVAASLIQGNTIKNISVTSSTSSDLFHAVAVAGAVALVNVSNNTIGSTGTGGAANGGITLASTASSVAGHAIILTGTGTNNVLNNTISNILMPNGNTVFTGIFNNTAITANISNNTIGSLTNPQSIYFSDATSSTTTGKYIQGIRIAPAAAASYAIGNNTIAGIWSNNAYTGSSGQLAGIYISSTAAIVTNVTGNVIKNLYSAAASTGTTLNSALIGICASSTGGTTNTVVGNTIDSLVSGATAGAVNIIGLYSAGSTATANNISRNFIHTLIAPATATATITGIHNNAGTSTFANNMVRLGINPDGTDNIVANTISGITSVTTSATNIYYNSIYIGGSGVGTTTNNTFAFRRTGTSGTYNVLDNIFVNSRSNATTGGTHFSIYFTTSNTGATVNNNLYSVTGTGGVFAYSGTANVTSYIPGWIASDGLSVTGSPQFLQPTGTASTVNLHLNTAVASVAESHGAAVTGITTDFDGDSRSGYSGSVAGSAPDIGADEYSGIFVPLGCTGTPTAGTSTASVANICPNIAFSLGLTPVSTVQGLSYQWISSPAGTNAWTALGAAQTTPVYSSTSLTASTDYRCVVTCTASNLRDTSVLVTVTLNPVSQCYCTPTVSTIDPQSFTTTGGVTNVSVGQTTASGYVNYMIDTVSALAGVTTVSFSGNNPGADGVAIWIDWNQDGTFASTERVYNTTSYNSAPSGSFAVPAVNGTTVLGGVTRMRVLNDFNASNPSNPCSLASGTYGQIQDFSFRVIPQTLCSGAPSPGNTNASVTSICVSGTSNLSLANNYITSSGINYQWQSSPNGTAWTDMTGVTTVTATTPTITQSTNYRCRLICTAGPDTAYSNPVLVTVNQLPTIVSTPALGAFCSAGSATLTASGAATYTWSPSATLSAATGTSVVATPTAITTYTITGTDANGCVNTGTATVGPISAFTPTATATNVCTSNLPVAITVSPITSINGSTEYKITDTLGATIADWQSSANFTITPTALGAYKYNVYARNTGCTGNTSAAGNVTFYVGFAGNVTINNATCANGNGSLVVGGTQGPGTPIGPIWYTNDFSTNTFDPNVASIQGAAVVTNNYLQLTPNTGSTSGGILIKNPTGISKVDSVKFTLTIPQTGGADGLSWSYGDITYPASSSYPFESGVGNKLIVSFDAYGTSGAGVAGTYLTFGQANLDGSNASQLYPTVSSTMLAYSSNTSWKGGSNAQIAISISSDNKLTLKVGTTVIFNAVQLPAAFANADKSAWQQIIGARTGGVSEEHDIDNLGIYSSRLSYAYGSSPANSGTVPTTWQSSPIFSGLNGGDSLDIWVANPSSPATCNSKLGTYGVTAPVMATFIGSGDPSCPGVADGYMYFNVNAQGTYGLSFNKNGGNTVVLGGNASQLNIPDTAVVVMLTNGTYTNVRLVNASGCVSAPYSTPIILTAPTTTTIAMASSVDSLSQPGAGTQVYTDGSCSLIATVTSPNNLGTVTTSLTVGSTIPTSSTNEPYLGRYIEITPTQNASLPATLKLYFTPADFTAYNASPLVGNASYPAILSDGSNLRIRAFHGVPTSGTTGPNGHYNAANADVIQPSSIVYNTNGYWEATFNSPNGFSGFFANTTTTTPLAIGLGDISAVNKGDVNVVSWNTKSELPGDRFSIERSTDGRAFNTIAQMDANGKAPSNYTYTDEKPFKGINYYRLISLNVDGSKETSKVVSATVKGGAAFQLAAYPNPATGSLTVTVSEVAGKGFVEIIDVTGRTLISQKMDVATSTIALTGLTQGMYVVKYHDDVNEGTIKLNKQ